MIGEDFANNSVGDVIAIFVNFTHINVLDWVVVRAELERTPNRLELSGFQGFAEIVLLRHITINSADCAID